MNFRQLRQTALKSGEFEDSGHDGQGHAVLLHVPTGTRITYPAHAGHRQSDVNTIRNVAKAIEDLLGRPVWKRGSRKPGRKVVTDTVSPALREKWARQREQILAERDRKEAQQREAEALARRERELREVQNLMR